ncbi:ATP-binding protein [Actinokineospora sp.]|uniref:ATP-binding protein n=1 Tax=Actinokineospora sp. TaxID=1872133 RepID=UPI00403771B0
MTVDLRPLPARPPAGVAATARAADLAPLPLIDIRIGRGYDPLAVVSAVIDPVVRRWCPDGPTAERVALAVHEAVADTIRHGNGARTGGTVEVTLSVDGDDLVVEVIDPGSGVDRGSGGRGLFLIRQAMDSVEVARTADGRTALVLRTRIPVRSAPDSEHVTHSVVDRDHPHGRRWAGPPTATIRG